MILSFINICKVPWEVLKTEGEAQGFQHLPRDIATVNEWKIMFDPYINKCFGCTDSSIPKILQLFWLVKTYM